MNSHHLTGDQTDTCVERCSCVCFSFFFCSLTSVAAGQPLWPQLLLLERVRRLRQRQVVHAGLPPAAHQQHTHHLRLQPPVQLRHPDDLPAAGCECNPNVIKSSQIKLYCTFHTQKKCKTKSLTANGHVEQNPKNQQKNGLLVSQQQYCFSFNMSSILQIFFSFSSYKLFPVCQELLETEDVLLPLDYQCKTPNQINRQQMCHPKVRTLQKNVLTGSSEGPFPNIINQPSAVSS